jgi:hypothetical protein
MKQLMAPHNPRHTHSSKLKVISCRPRPKNFYYLVIIVDSDSHNFKKILGQLQKNASPYRARIAESACPGERRPWPKIITHKTRYGKLAMPPCCAISRCRIGFVSMRYQHFLIRNAAEPNSFFRVSLDDR